jgi:hypothetical protein
MSYEIEVNMKNRRRSERIPVKKRIMFAVSDSYFFAQTRNVSESGIAIESENIFPPKSRISLQSYTGTETIILDGMVVWSLSNMMGIKLTKTIHECDRYPVH